ncbi:MgtC/SapB family protein [Legionella londiniensis]|uniref:Transmembrane protein n=1 Tax=Legionella londiniensis TaxID=45068 RepID=A0A0W0VLW0_9GAMM|nr:MgtC/SapB family protein [Legionella londiniensis]KTD21089.1 transmembrane protein [Legionella londiniensis]STX93665.1 transmembrane protein [Legionella londiniensis]
MLELIQPFLLSFLIGLLIGIERERSQADGIKAIGMRTFILFALLGTLSAKIKIPLLTLSVSLFIFAAILLSYFRATQNSQKTRDIGITTEMAAATVFLLGYLILEHRALSMSIAIAILLILYGRPSLHRFAREKITAKEIEASITIIIISLAIISFLPDQTIDPWGLFNPQNFGIIFLILASLQFGGYIVIRLFGKRLGIILIGFFGGFVSSTAVFASLSQETRTKTQTVYSGVLGGVFATIATMLAFLMVILAVSPNLFKFVILPIIAAIASGGLSTWFFLHNGEAKIQISYPNPLDYKALIKLGLLIMGILLLVAITQKYLGTRALGITAFITGLFELQAMAYAIALFYQKNVLSLPQTLELLSITILASFISKFALVWLIARNRFAAIISLYLAGMLAVAAVVYFLMLTMMIKG